MLHRHYYFLLLAIFTLGLTACSGEPETGPVEVRWDQNNCERCRMMLSDPHFAAQIRYFPEAKRSKVVKFDDIGCATLWLKDRQWNNDSNTEIWVADYRSGEWIDARKATYLRNKPSPMGYNLGALAEADSNLDTEGLSFAEAKQHIKDVENKFNKHGKQHHHHGLKQQGMEREAEK